jgi:hypothetical protein
VAEIQRVISFLRCSTARALQPPMTGGSLAHRQPFSFLFFLKFFLNPTFRFGEKMTGTTNNISFSSKDPGGPLGPCRETESLFWDGKDVLLHGGCGGVVT